MSPFLGRGINAGAHRNLWCVGVRGTQGLRDGKSAGEREGMCGTFLLNPLKMINNSTRDLCAI